MYSYISGKLASVTKEGIVIDNHGIGYHILVPGTVYDRLPATGQEVKVHTYLQVREDAWVLFGFLRAEELELFRLLITVNGIGPKGALAILSVLSVDDLRFAILSEDEKAISAAPGIGPKTARRIILDLKDKIDFEEAFEERSFSAAAASPLGGVKSEVVEALTALGYAPSDVLKAMQQMEIDENASVEELLKQTLKQMAFL